MTQPPMSLSQELKKYQSSLLSRIGKAASASDTRTLFTLNEELRATASLLSRMEQVEDEARALLGGGAARQNGVTSPQPTKLVNTASVAGRGHGVKIRGDFLQRAATSGLVLRPYNGAIYSSSSGQRIGIAVATERKPDRWFLGLTDGEFDAAVLVCESASGQAMDICLPKKFFAQYGRYLSRSGGQIKFNVARRKGHILLKVPSQTPQRVDQYVDAIEDVDQ
jgi:hypothetical protein